MVFGELRRDLGGIQDYSIMYYNADVDSMRSEMNNVFAIHK